MSRWVRGLLAVLAIVSTPAFFVRTLSAGEAVERQWIVVTAPAFRDAIQPLCKQRESEKFHVEVVETTNVLSSDEIVAGNAEKLRRRVRDLCADFKGTSYVLLVGAVEAGKLADPEKKVVPALHGTEGRMKGQPSDNAYGCLDEGFVPGVAVGRFPARSVQEAEGMVRKTLTYENDRKPGEWRQRITVLAGVPEFNPLVDRLVESMAMSRFGKLDPSWTGQAIYHTEQSRFCLPDDQLHERALAYVEAGQAITLYLGHSGPQRFYARNARFLDREDWSKLKISRGQGIFATFGCNGCQLSGEKGEGYGIYAMRNPDGPVAVAGSHGICFAAMVQLATEGLFRSFSERPPERFGSLWLEMKKELGKGEINEFLFDALDAVDGDSKIPLATQRLEHLEMFVLLGDPALKLPVLTKDIRLTATDVAAVPGQRVHVEGELPPRLRGADIRLTLERPVDSKPVGLEVLPSGPVESRARVMLANHERANKFVIQSQGLKAGDTQFAMEFELPAKVPWQKLIVRAYAVHGEADGQGVIVVPVKKP
jgi:hypothetical protein